MKITNYKAVSRPHITDLVESVECLIKQGYQPFNGLGVVKGNNILYVQAMVKYEEEQGSVKKVTKPRSKTPT